MSPAEPVRLQQPQSAPRRVSVLGATGSIGASTIDLIERQRDQYEVEALTANRNGAALAKLAIALGARFAAVAEPDCYAELKDALSGTGIEAAAGADALVEAAARPADWVMAAIAGAAGLAPTLAALSNGQTVAVANKECLVCAGHHFMRHARSSGATILPVDSEHNALFQSLGAGRREDVAKLVITGSGGPFRTASREQIAQATVEQALKHPNWSMGPKVTIDSATLMNKGLELIEAHHLFAMPESQIEVLIHPQSVVHGLVEYRDGSVVAQLGAPDMRIPIAHCLAHPVRIDTPVQRLNLARTGTLTFEAPDLDRFPALALARAALQRGGAAPTVLNAANEIAVAAFLAGRLAFAGIPALVEATMAAAERQGIAKEPGTAGEALGIDHDSRQIATSLLSEIAAKHG